MISKYDVVEAFSIAKKKEIETTINLSEDKMYIIDSQNGEMVCTVDDYVALLRKKTHCDFEVLCDLHATLEVVYRCKECGTVIFTREDESYERNLCCPTCSDYKTQFKYWTKEQIEADSKKQDVIKFYTGMQKELDESEARRKKRGKYDWEIWKQTVKFKSCKKTYSLECINLFNSGLKGLHLNIDTWEPDEDGFGYVKKKSNIIPLSPYAIYLYWSGPMKY